MRKTISADDECPLTATDAAIVSRTVAGCSVAEIAVEFGCGVDKVYRRLRLPHVRAAVTQARADEVRPMVATALNHARLSVERLAAVRDDETARHSDRINAAKALIAWFNDMWQLSEVMPRLAVLEAKLDAHQGRGAEPDAPTITPRTNPVRPVPFGLVGDDTEVE